MTKCWNIFCIAGDCDGVDHVDVTGDTWSERKGFEFNPETGEYDLPEGSGPVVTLHRREGVDDDGS